MSLDDDERVHLLQNHRVLTQTTKKNSGMNARALRGLYPRFPRFRTGHEFDDLSRFLYPQSDSVCFSVFGSRRCVRSCLGKPGAVLEGTLNIQNPVTEAIDSCFGDLATSDS